MKTESDVRAKFRGLKFRYLSRFLRNHLSVEPHNCVYNHIHEDSDGSVQLCMLGAEDVENWPGNICDTTEQAESCPFFKQKHDKGDLKTEFEKRLEIPEILFSEYRDLAMLKWVMDETAETGDLDYQDDLTWWQKFRLWAGGT